MSLVLRVLSVGFFTLAVWQFAASESGLGQNNPALFGPSTVNTMMGPQRTMPLGPFGPYDLFSVYLPAGLYARQPLGHEIIRTSPNGYTYRTVFEPPQGSVQQGAMPLVTAPPANTPSINPPPAVGQPNAWPPGTLLGNAAPMPNGLGPMQWNAPPAAPPANPAFTPEMRRLLDLAENAFRAGRYDEALDKVQTLLDGKPDLGLAALLHAETLFALGKYPEGAAALHWAISNLPRQQWGVIVENYRHFYAQPEKFTEQLRSLENYVRQNPTIPAGHFLLGFHYGYLGRRAEAAGQLAAALELSQFDDQARQLGEQFRDPNAPPVRSRPQVAPGPANPIPAPRGPQEF
jgi:hypothetical protein